MAEPRSDIKALLFDLDGTLLDTHDIILASFRYTMETILGKEFPEEVLMAKVGQPLDTQMEDFSDGDEALRQLLADTYRTHNDTIHDERVKAFPGVLEGLVRLRGMGYRLGVVTSKRHELAERGLRITGLVDNFECIVGSDDWPEHKPLPGCVVHGTELLGIETSECMYVGDSPFDMMAGNGAGCVTVAACWGMFPRDVLAQESPALLCDDMDELVAALS